MMNKTLACLGLLVSSCVRLWAFDPAEMGEITFANKLSDGSALESIFVAPAGSGVWGPDLLRALKPAEFPNRIPRGDEISCYLVIPESGAAYDVLALDITGRSYLVKNLRVTRSREAIASFTDRSKSATAARGLSLGQIFVSNETGVEIYYLFSAPPDSYLWGVEILNRERTLPAGQSLSLYILRTASGFSRDIIAVDKNGKLYKKKLTIQEDFSANGVRITERDAVLQP